MQRRISILAGLWIALTVLAMAVHKYTWFRLEFGALSESIAKPLGNLISLLTFAGFIPVRIISGHIWANGPRPWIIYALGFAGLLVALQTALFIRRRLLRAARTRADSRAAPAADAAAAHSSGDNTHALSRRRFLFDGCGAALLTTSGGAAAHAALVAPWKIELQRYTIPIRGLPPTFEGLRLVHISDTHLGPRITAAHIDRAVRMALDLRPDLFLLTGDYISAGSQYIDHAAEQFRPLTAASSGAIATLAVLGNHDWYSDGPAMRAALVARGIRMIDNDRLFLDGPSRTIAREPPSSNTPAICFAGIGDLWMDTTDTASAFRGVPASSPCILLTHEPDTAELPALRDPANRVDLMLCGHTHGGQVRIPFLGTPILPSEYGQKYAGGLVAGPRFPVIVSRGVGMSMIPVRFGVPPEIAQITLTRAH